MIAKRFPNAKMAQSPGTFADRLTYVLTGAAQADVQHLIGDPAEDQPLIVRQVALALARNPCARHPICHIMLSLSETQDTGNDTLIASGRRVLELIGAGPFQAVFAVHRNRPSTHLHIVLNRVHPANGTVLSLWQDYARLEFACRQVELEQGWPQDRGRFETDVVDGTVQLLPRSEAEWQTRQANRAAGIRPDSQTQRLRERHRGQPSLRDTLPTQTLRDLAQEFDAAQVWSDVFLACAQRGLAYLRARGGARIRRLTDGAMMLASQLGTRFGLRALERRLGPCPLASPPPDRHSERRPRIGSDTKPPDATAPQTRDLLRWRYRGASSLPVDPGYRPPPAPFDMTRARQLWLRLRDPDMTPPAPSPLTHLLQRFSDDLLELAPGQVLLPLRNEAESVTGFLRLTAPLHRQTDPPWQVDLAQGSATGFGLIGLRDAATVWILPDPALLMHVLPAIATQPGPDLLITALPDTAPPLWQAMFKTLARRKVRVTGTPPFPTDWLTMAKTMIPDLQTATIVRRQSDSQTPQKIVSTQTKPASPTPRGPRYFDPPDVF